MDENAPTLEQNQTQSCQSRKLIIEVLQFIIIATFIILPIRLFVAQPFIVNGASMEPTFDTGEYLIVDQVSYHFENPQRGDVVIFRYPYDTSKYFIKRVIGLPHETISITDGVVTIKNSAEPYGFTLEEPYTTSSQDSFDQTTLGVDEYYVMGDNRSDSFDSRSWGPLKIQYITGRPLIRLFPLQSISVLPGAQTQ